MHGQIPGSQQTSPTLGLSICLLPPRLMLSPAGLRIAILSRSRTMQISE